MKTGIIKQYIPLYFSGVENKENTFGSLKELLNIEWVDNFRKLPNRQINPKFHQYSISKYSDHKGYEYILIAEYENGHVWWVIGYVDKNDIIKELPIFKAKYKKE